MTCCDVECFLLNFFHFAVGHYLQSKCCLLLSVLNTRVEYFEANLQKTPLPHGESRQMHCMFLMCMVMLFVHVGEAVRALQRSSVVSPTTASKPTRFHDRYESSCQSRSLAVDASIDTNDYILILPYVPS